MNSYRYSEPEATQAFKPLEEGEYDFVILSAAPIKRSNAGNHVLPLKLAVGKQQAHIYDNPWAGTDRNGEAHDNIAKLLKCVNRAPAVGKEPDWNRLEGARGRAHVKIEVAEVGTYAGKPVNRIAYYIFANDIRNAPPTKPYVDAQGQPDGLDVDEEGAPKDIPF